MLNQDVGYRQENFKPPRRSISSFEECGFLGEGKFSKVIKMRERDTGNFRAVKIIKKADVIKEKTQKYVIREKKIMKKLRHPFIIKLYGTFQTDTDLYFVLSLAPNGDLHRYIHALNGLSLDTIKYYSSQLILALEYLHNLKIIHRDVKPENILLGDNLQILLTDFGVAKDLSAEGEADQEFQCQNPDFAEYSTFIEFDFDSDEHEKPSLSKMKSFVGSHCFAPPEMIALHDSSYGTDIWSLGVTMYYMRTKSHPFDNLLMISENSLKESLQSFPVQVLGSSLFSLLEKLLVFDPKARLGSIESPQGFEGLKSHPFFNVVTWTDETFGPPPCEILDEAKKINSPNSMLRILQCDDLFHDAVINELKKRQLYSKWNTFARGETIIMEGVLYKYRKSIKPKVRMFLITTGPKIMYFDETTMSEKGEIIWDQNLKWKVKDDQHFQIIVPKRIYDLESKETSSWDWAEILLKIHNHYFKTSC